MSDLSRRALLGAGAVIAGASLVQPGSAVAQAGGQGTRPPRVRRNVATLTPDSPDLQALGYAIGQMKARSDALSWERQVAIHAGNWHQHWTWRFLPWHRAQIYWFERIVARVSGYPDFAMPYWDWQSTPVLPDLFLDPASPFWNQNRRPGLERVDFTQARANDPRFPGWANVYGDDFGVFAGSPNSAGAVETSGHGFVHMTVLGDMRDPDTAPRDPIFWFHHCNIDHVWDTWQQGAEQRGVQMDPDWMTESFNNFVNERGVRAKTLTTASVLHPALNRELNYQYDAPYSSPWFDDQQPKAPPGTTRREKVSSRPVKITLSNDPGAVGTLRIPLSPDVAALLASDKTGQTLELKGKGTVHLSGENISGVAVRIGVKHYGPTPSPSILMGGAIGFGGTHHMAEGAMPAMVMPKPAPRPSRLAKGKKVCLVPPPVDPHAHAMTFQVGTQLFDATGYDDVEAVEVEATVSWAAPPRGDAPVPDLPVITGLDLDLVVNQYRWV